MHPCLLLLLCPSPCILVQLGAKKKKKKLLFSQQLSETPKASEMKWLRRIPLSRKTDVHTEATAKEEEERCAAQM